MIENIKIAIAEDHEVTRFGLVKILSNRPEINIVSEARNGKELLKNIKLQRPHIVLLDIAMPQMGGIKAIQEIRERYPKVQIIVFSAYDEDTSVIEYVKLGASAFLPKSARSEELIKAILQVRQTGSYFEERILKLLNKHGANPPGTNTQRPLSEKEVTILKYLMIGLSNEKIAIKMQVKPITLEWYKHQLLRKTNTQTLEELLEYGRRNGVG